MKIFILPLVIFLSACGASVDDADRVLTSLTCEVPTDVQEFSATVGTLQHAAQTLDLLFGPQGTTLDSNLDSLREFICDNEQSVSDRSHAVDMLYEMSAISTALDSGGNVPVTWQNDFTGSFGQVDVTHDYPCALAKMPSYSPNLRLGFAMSATEIFCREKGSWTSVNVVGVEAIPVESFTSTT